MPETQLDTLRNAVRLVLALHDHPEASPPGSQVHLDPMAEQQLRDAAACDCDAVDWYHLPGCPRHTDEMGASEYAYRAREQQYPHPLPGPCTVCKGSGAGPRGPLTVRNLCLFCGGSGFDLPHSRRERLVLRVRHLLRKIA
jgi:hypothetical protein